MVGRLLVGREIDRFKAHKKGGALQILQLWQPHSKIALINLPKNDEQILRITGKYTYYLQHFLLPLQISIWQKYIKSQYFNKLNKTKLMFRI